MQAKIEAYRAGLPVCMPVTDEDNYYGNFEAEFRNFWTNSSYYCIFSGMGFHPDSPMPKLRYRDDARSRADRMFEQIATEANDLVQRLPSNYEYLMKLHGRDAASASS